MQKRKPQENDRTRFAVIVDRLQQLGLTEEQIRYALYAKRATLSADQVTMIEEWVTLHKTVSIEFKIAENNQSKIDIKWTSGSTATILPCREGQEQVALGV